MTVKEVFELRKQGRLEEAYDAIRPMYAVHKGKYTTLAMFWVGSDMLKKRLSEGQKSEAVAIFKALVRLYPNVDDGDGRCRYALLAHLCRLSESTGEVRVLDYVAAFPLRDTDWQIQTTPHGSIIHSVAQRLVKQGFGELQQDPSIDNALLAMPLLEQAMAHAPHDDTHLHFMAQVYHIMGDEEKMSAIMPKTTFSWPLPFDVPKSAR